MSRNGIGDHQQGVPQHRPNDALMWDADIIAEELHIGRRTLSRWIAAGIFPPADLAFGAKVRRWKRETVLEWIKKNSLAGGR